MNDYKVIFQQRANDYHFAMQQYPHARSQEFEKLLANTDFSVVNKVLDVPSGGGYMKNYIPKNVSVTLTDFSEGFTNKSISLVSPDKLPFESASFDVVLSLSGMHHLQNVPQFIEECLRVTKNEGYFIFADVKKNTKVDIFLNQFVNQYNSMGHCGNFFSENDFENYPNIQNKIITCKYNEYPFMFKAKAELIHFFKLLFGLDKATETQIFNGVNDILGINQTNSGLEVNWGLLHFKLKK